MRRGRVVNGDACCCQASHHNRPQLCLVAVDSHGSRHGGWQGRRLGDGRLQALIRRLATLSSRAVEQHRRKAVRHLWAGRLRGLLHLAERTQSALQLAGRIHAGLHSPAAGQEHRRSAQRRHQDVAHIVLCGLC